MTNEAYRSIRSDDEGVGKGASCSIDMRTLSKREPILGLMKKRKIRNNSSEKDTKIGGVNKCFRSKRHCSTTMNAPKRRTVEEIYGCESLSAVSDFSLMGFISI